MQTATGFPNERRLPYHPLFSSLDFGGYPDLSGRPYGVEQRLQIFLIEAVYTRLVINPEGPGLTPQGGQHVGEAGRLLRPVPGRKADGEVPTGFGPVRIPKDNQGIGPHRHWRGALHGVLGSVLRIFKAEAALDPTEGFFEGPSLARQFDDLPRGQFEVGIGEHIVLLVTRPVSDP